MKVIDYKKVKLPNIQYQEPVKTAGGSLISRTSYRHLDQAIPIYIQTPRLKVNSDLEILDSKTYIELELDKRHINFYEFINNIDDLNIRETFKNSENWFQEKLPMDVVDDFYKTNIKMRKYNKSPIIKFKIPLYKNKTRKSCDIFGDDLKPVDVSEIKQKTEVICILELEGIKFFKQRFETEWKVIQLRVYKPKEAPTPCLINESFLSDNEDSISQEPFPEDGISLNSSIASDITENENLDTNEVPVDEEIKNISIQMENENKNKSVNVEKVEENISLEILPNPETTTTTNEKSKTIEIEKNNLDIPENVEDPSTASFNEEREETESVVSGNEIEENNYSLESDLEDEEDEDDESNHGEPLENYFSDNFTDEEEICDGLENNLEVVSFLENENNYDSENESDNENQSGDDEKRDNLKENTNTNTQIVEEEVNLENGDKEEVTKTLNSQLENIDEEYQNKSIQELIQEISKFKKIASDKENEMSELKSKYRNLYSELNL